MTENRALEPSFWRERLAPYTEPRVGRSVLELATSVVPYLVVTAASYALIQVSYLLVLVLAVPAAGFLLRTFIVFHDCAHGSFFANRTVNKWVGMVCALLVFTPFHSWRHEHAVHHDPSRGSARRGRRRPPDQPHLRDELPRRRRLGDQRSHQQGGQDDPDHV